MEKFNRIFYKDVKPEFQSLLLKHCRDELMKYRELAIHKYGLDKTNEMPHFNLNHIRTWTYDNHDIIDVCPYCGYPVVLMTKTPTYLKCQCGKFF